MGGGLRVSSAPRPPLLASRQWQKFLDLGGHISDERLDSIIDAQKPNQCCALVYSLVATGPPKIIMLSHDNVSVTRCGEGWHLCTRACR